MVTYKEPFIKLWNKCLKNELFPNLLSNVQNIQLEVSVGTGWDWLSTVPVDSTLILLDISESEIVQCNFTETGFICYVNFGKGYRFLEIPFNSISAIYIGSWTNWIKNPVPPTKFNLTEEIITYLNESIDKESEDQLND